MVARTWSSAGFFLGHRRLSIIDLKSECQPMATENGRLIITFNGEIYNYVELREELRSGLRFQHRFRHRGAAARVCCMGNGPSATISSACLPLRLPTVCDEAFSRARPVRREAPAVLEDPHGVSFASELAPLAGTHDRAFRRHSRFGRIPLFELRAWHPNPSEWRSSDTARNMEVVSCGRHHRFGPVLHPFENSVVPPRSLQEVLTELEQRLDSAVNMALRSDVPVGIFLSSGIDSSLVARSAARAGRVSQAYCLTFAEQGFSEWEGAQMTAHQLGVPLTRVHMSSQVLAEFLSIADHADDPLADSSAVAVWTLARAAAQTNKVGAQR